MDPDARVFPLWAPDEETGLQEGELGYDPDAPRRVSPNIRQPWIAAARGIGVEGDDEQVAEVVFHALLGVGASRDWLEGQGVPGEFPTVPLPGELSALLAAATTGRRYAALVDPDHPVPGVTTGQIEEPYQGLGVPDATDGETILEVGSHGRAGGQRVGTSLLWDDQHGWRNVPERAWNYALGGFNPLAKMLSYRVGDHLTDGDRRLVMHCVRRLAALDDLATIANAHHAVAVSSPLDAAP